MIGEHNLRAIKRGDTWALPLSFWEDECQEVAINVSTYTFKLMAKNSSGTTIFTWDNAIFVQGATNERTVTLSAVTTATYTLGEFNYELQVTTGSGVFTWMQGFVQVVDQITS
jgi:hypothetical protein